MNWEVRKWENGEPKRPLTRQEFRDQLAETLAQWVDAFRGHDSEMEEAQTMIEDIADECSDRMDDLFEASSKPDY